MGSRTRRVLIADDHQDAADTLAILLRMAGYDAQVAYGGAEAIQLARTFNPEVAILDINMPGIDGYDVASALRREGRPDRRPLLIALTALSGEEDARRSQDAGFHHHVVKPTPPGALVQLIEAFLERRATRERPAVSAKVEMRPPGN